jgi:hypothetical protein
VSILAIGVGVGAGVRVVGAGTVLWRSLDWCLVDLSSREAYHMFCAWWCEQYGCVRVKLRRFGRHVQFWCDV